VADPTSVRAVLDDLRDEGDDLDRIVAALAPHQWALPTPAPGWAIAHQIAHLSWTDAMALRSVTDPDAFAAEAGRAASGVGRFVDEGAEAGATDPPDRLLARWRHGRAELLDALGAQPVDTRFPWFGPPMSTASMATGRLMETWAHGQDVADTLGVVRTPTDRLRHVARIGVRAREYAFTVNGLTPPGAPFRVELTLPGGELWAHGPEGAAQLVTGPALDFCLLVTQRRNRADLDVHAEGPDADRWLDIAQAFAGPPGTGRPPHHRKRSEGAPKE
jgi:uncharacterized protein (TIGR03084 family)